MLVIAIVAGIWSAASASQQRSVDARIARIEAGLLPGVMISGVTAPAPMADRLKHYAVPGLGVAVINDGKIEWARGYGVTEAGTTTRVTPDTLFQAASISKPVAAMAMLALVEQGALALDEDVNVKLKSWKVPENDFTKQERVTLRRLASHSAGLTVSGFRGYAASDPVPTPVQLLDGLTPANSAPVRADLVPGSRYRYSGGGITVMQVLMTDVTSQPFPALMQKLVLGKLEMSHSTYEQPLPAGRTAQAAAGHLSAGEMIVGKWHTYPEMAAAGLWTTPSDLATFAIELQRSYAGTSNRVLSQASTKQMVTKQAGEYGLGIGLGGEGQHATFSHGGSNQGFRCTLFAYLHSGKGAVVMTNGDQGSALASEVLRSIAREYGWPDYQPTVIAPVTVSADLLKTYAGEYELKTRVVVTAEAGRLFLQAPGDDRGELYAVSETEFVEPAGNLRIVFVSDAQGAVTEFIVRQSGGTPATFKRVK